MTMLKGVRRVSKQIDPMTQLILASLKIKGMGPQSVKKFLETVSDPQVVLNDFNYFKKSTLTPIKKALNNNFLNAEVWDNFTDQAFQEWDKAQQENIEIINFQQKEFPQNLLFLKKYPLVLYAKGDVSLLNGDKMVAMIGTRKPTKFAEKFGERVSEYFAEKLGYVIVSGLAIGCDTVSHLGAMNTTKRTIAILAHGLDMPVYPKRNQKLAAEMVEEGGLLLSTYPLGTKLMPQYLAARDEWQSGISDGVIALETGLKGGTNIAMNHALHQERPLAVIDHLQHFDEATIDQIPQAQGNLAYIKEGKATGLYGSKSLDEFDQKMRKTHQQRFLKLNKTSPADSQKEADPEIEQTHLNL